MNLTDRINRKDERREPTNIVPIVERRRTPRWIEWTQEHQTEQTANVDLTGYIRETA